MQERGTPNYLRTVNLIAPVVPKTGGAFNFNPQYLTAGKCICKVQSLLQVPGLTTVGHPEIGLLLSLLYSVYENQT